jgi:phage terminase small subunit
MSLTAKQARFVTEYLVDGNGTQAAIRAGYSQRTANEQGSQLLAKLSIAEAVAEGQQALTRATIADAAERREVATAILRNTEEEANARLKAADVLNKMDGLYVQKHLVAVGSKLEDLVSGD